MSNSKKFKMFNNTKGSLSFKGVDDKVYIFTTPDSYKLFSIEVIEGLYNEYPNMIIEGYVVFDDVKVYESLDVDKEVYEKLLRLSELPALLDGDIDTLSEKLENMPKPIQENLVTIAREKGIDSKKKTKVIKEKTGFDIDGDIE